jgi:hypothetical protein
MAWVLIYYFSSHKVAELRQLRTFYSHYVSFIFFENRYEWNTRTSRRYKLAPSGGYERNDMMPSVEIATKIADALAVSLDFLVGKSSLIVKDTNILERMEDIAKLPEDKKIELFNVMDAYLRDFKTSRAYSK